MVESCSISKQGRFIESCYEEVENKLTMQQGKNSTYFLLGELLDDGRSPLEVARDYSPPLRLHHETARATPEQRKEMLGRVISQMLQGKRVGLVCSCAPKACHGDVIAAKLVRMYCEIASP